MGRGCLVELGRLVTLACLRLGAILVSVLINGIGFMLLNVLGPFCLGMTRETVHRMAARWQTSGGYSRFPVGDQVLYSLAGGALWVAGYIFLSTGVCFATLIAALLSGQIILVPVVWFCVLAVACIVFVVGAVAGALAYQYEEGVFSRQ